MATPGRKSLLEIIGIPWAEQSALIVPFSGSLDLKIDS
jgi:hypothetical protein